MPGGARKPGSPVPVLDRAKLLSLTEGWITINSDDNGEGGQRVYVDGAGKMQTGVFAGKTFDQAFKKGGTADKLDAKKGDEPKASAEPEPSAKPVKSAAHPLLSDPDAMTAKDVKTVITDTPREERAAVVAAITKARPDLEMEANYQWQMAAPKKAASPNAPAADESFEVNAANARKRVDAGRSAFPKVNTVPYSKGDIGASQADKAALPVEVVNLSDLKTVQTTVNPDKVNAFASGTSPSGDPLPPYVVRTPDGRMFIEDGNNRLSADVIAGKTKARVRVLDVDADGKFTPSRKAN